MREFFEAMRYVRSRTNANEFMEWFFPNKPFDDYHMNKWVISPIPVHQIRNPRRVEARAAKRFKPKSR